MICVYLHILALVVGLGTMVVGGLRAGVRLLHASPIQAGNISMMATASDGRQRAAVDITGRHRRLGMGRRQADTQA